MKARYSACAQRPQAPMAVAPFHQWVMPDGTLWTQFFRHGQGYVLRFPGLADFEVDAAGTFVNAFPVPGVSAPTVEHLYLNQVLPLALSRQGRLVLHGSAVDVHGNGVAFLGESGRGKSTLAASFAREGIRFLTDDGLLIERAEGEHWVLPSHPSIRLWADSEAALVGKTDQRAPGVSFTAKARFLAGRGIPFCDARRPLRRLYFLGEGTVQRPVLAPLRPAQALIELVKHSFLLDIEARDLLARHFDDLSHLADLPICFSLDYPRDYAGLPAVRAAVERHLSECVSGGA